MVIWPFSWRKGKTISTETGHGFLFQQPIQNIASWLAQIICKGVHLSDSCLFCKLVNTSSGIRIPNHKLSYSHALELLRKVLQAIHLDDKKYGLHSMRSGGASLAAALGVPDRLIMRQINI